VEDAVKASPADVAAALNEALVANAEVRKNLVDVILANASNTFTADELASFTKPQLSKLASLAAVKPVEVVANTATKPAPVYAGSAPVTNAAVKETGFLPPSTLG
jgi:hypothetical protein